MDPMDVDDFQHASDAFLNWLKNNGATISPKIQLADLRDRAAGRGVVAMQDLAEDEELFSIPKSSILTAETSDLPAAVRKEIDHPWLSLILAMVYEYLRGNDSPWQPYFALLPESFDSLMFWSDIELSYLQGSAVTDKIGKESADSTFSEQLIPIIAQHTDIFRTAGRSNSELLALCHRMGSTIMAYAFDLDKPESDQPTINQQTEEEWEEEEEEEKTSTLPKGMIPLADMLNANADLNNAKLFFSSEDHNNTTAFVTMKTIRPVPAGTELYNDFGALPRADLLRRYGYVTERYARYDVVEISSDLIRTETKSQLKLSDSEIELKWQYASEQDIADDAYDISRASNSGNSKEEGQQQQIPDELCILLNLLTTPKAAFEKLKKKDKLPKTDLTSDAKKLLRAVLVHRYAAYPVTSTSDDMDQDLSGRRAMAKQVIDGEKQVLREAVAAVSETNTTNKKRSADTLEDEANAIRQPTKR
ncbi:Ribosomal lysine N-methyltransferase 4 [Cercospora zeina]